MGSLFLSSDVRLLKRDSTIVSLRTKYPDCPVALRKLGLGIVTQRRDLSLRVIGQYRKLFESSVTSFNATMGFEVRYRGSSPCRLRQHLGDLESKVHIC